MTGQAYQQNKPFSKLVRLRLTVTAMLENQNATMQPMSVEGKIQL